MNSLTVILISIFLIGCYYLIKKASLGIPGEISQVKRYIDWLLEKGTSSGFLIITHKDSEKFIQFHKYIEKNTFGIELSFPNANWSENYFYKLIKHCKNNNISYRINKGSNQMEFLDIDFGQNSEKAYEFIEFIVSKIYKIPSSAKYYFSLHNCDYK